MIILIVMGISLVERSLSFLLIETGTRRVAPKGGIGRANSISVFATVDDMGQIRECTVCHRQQYSVAEFNWNCTHNRKGTDCRGVMRLVTQKERPRNVWGGSSGRKMGEFW